MSVVEVYLDGFDNGSDHPDYTVAGVYRCVGGRMTLLSSGATPPSDRTSEHSPVQPVHESGGGYHVVATIGHITRKYNVK